MFRKILVCTDLSLASEPLFGCVSELKLLGVQEVVLAHVIHVTNPLADHSKAVEHARQLLFKQKKSLEEMNLQVSAAMPLGAPAHELVEIAKEQDISGVVIGSHGKSPFRAETLGSVSSAILHQVKKPVLLLRNKLQAEPETDSRCKGMFSRILFPTDFSETAERAVDYLGKIALETHCAVTVMHVLGKRPHDPSDVERQEEAAQYLLESKKRRLQTLGAHEVTIDLHHGHPTEEILAAMERTQCTMILMGTHGKGLIQEVLVGSVASEVARSATVPIIFIPAGA